MNRRQLLGGLVAAPFIKPLADIIPFPARAAVAPIQPLDATLKALAALSWSSGGQIVRFTSADTFDLIG